MDMEGGGGAQVSVSTHRNIEGPMSGCSGPYSKLVHTTKALYAVGHALSSAALHLAAIDPGTGATLEIAWKHIPPPVPTFVVAADIVAWVDPTTQTLAFLQLLPTLKAHIRTEKTLNWTAVVDVDLQKAGLVVGVLANGDAKGLKALEGGVLKAVHTFSANDGPQSLFAGGMDKESKPYIARLWTTVSNASALPYLLLPITNSSHYIDDCGGILFT